LLFALSILLATTAPATAPTVVDSPELPIRFINAIADICIPTTRGHPPTAQNATILQLEPNATLPPYAKQHYGRATSWFRLKSAPANVFIGVGDRNNCHLVLANTRQTREIQQKTVALLTAAGAKVLSNTPNDQANDILFAQELPDGMLLLSLQAPHDTINNGEDDQGALHIGMMSKADFAGIRPRP